MTFDKDNVLQMFETTMHEIKAMIREGGKTRAIESKCDEVIKNLERAKHGIKRTAETV
jgi:hypothetical protein